MSENEDKVETFAEVSWCVEDIVDEYNCTEEQAEEFLERHAKYISEAMVEAGWAAIACFIQYPMIDEEEEEDS